MSVKQMRISTCQSSTRKNKFLFLKNFGGRRGKQSDFKSQIESVAFQYNTKIRNISCIMQELGYLDAQLEPNFVRITERVSKLSIDEELKQDMLDGIKFCKQFSVSSGF